MLSNGAHATERLFTTSFCFPLAMSDGFATPSESDDPPPAQTNHSYDYDLYGPSSMEEDDMSNESADPVLPLVTQSCFLDTASPPTVATREAIGRSFGQSTTPGANS